MIAKADRLELTVRKVRLNRGGYDASGSYWGLGAPLYWFAYEIDGVEFSGHVRAASRNQARLMALQDWCLRVTPVRAA